MARSCAEIGTLIFAIVHLISVIGLSLSGFVYVISLYSLFWVDGGGTLGVLSGAIVYGGVIILLVTLTFVSMIFSSYLLNGVLKKKPEHLKVYFIYSIVQCCLAPFAIAYLFIKSEDSMINIYIAIAVTCYCVFNALILCMIRCTYLQYEKHNKEDHINLFREY